MLIVGSETLRAEVFWSIAAWLDPRGVDVHAFERADIKRSRRPELTVWFDAQPAKGRIGLYYTGWYGLSVDDFLNDRLGRRGLRKRFKDAEELEEILLRDGYRILKLWLTVSAEHQASRLARLVGSPSSTKKSLRTDRLIARKHKRWMRLTNFAANRGARSPWTIVDIEDDTQRQLVVAEQVAAALETENAALPRVFVPIPPRDHLSTVNLSLRVSKKKYNRELASLTAELSRLFERVNDDGLGLILAFEGWDAAGKGGVIKRLLAASDPRLISAVRVAAPTSEQLSRHYLWRFSRNVPEAGQISVFDRSWYGRVLVERVEGLTQPERWKDAYDEIIRFERELAHSRYLVLKFWLHVTPEEQLRRFRERENVEYKSYKLTDEDWRNREKRPDYEAAVNEMLERTNHRFGRWHLVSAEDKRRARLEVLRAVAESLSATLRRS